MLSAATGVVVAIAILTTLIPAWRVSRIDPIRVLRSE